MRWRALWIGLGLLLFGSATGARAGIALRFDSPSYAATTNGPVTVGIHIDGNDQMDGDQPVAHGLFSFGVRVQFPAAAASVSRNTVAIVPALDYTGLVPGAQVELGNDYVLCRGNVALIGKAASYDGATLLTFTLRNLAAAQSSYFLTLSTARTDSSGDLFVDGQGQAFDRSVSFGKAQVLVTIAPPPEPPRLSVRPLPPDAIELTYLVANGLDHYPQFSESLQSWSDLFPVPRNDGRILIKSSDSARFFRLRTKPVP